MQAGTSKTHCTGDHPLLDSERIEATEVSAPEAFARFGL
jgi:hypothetical protein